MDKIEIMATAIRHTYDGSPAEIALALDSALEEAGFAIVPVEPTEAMVDRFVSRALQVTISDEGSWSNYARNQYKAMLKAAQKEV